jgi:hypothetical protein
MKEVLNCQHVVSNLERNTRQAEIYSMVYGNMVKEIANKITGLYMKEDIGDYSTTYSSRIIVCDYDDFYKAVEEEASRLRHLMFVPSFGKN